MSGPPPPFVPHPLTPFGTFEGLHLRSGVELHATARGGHVGWLGRAGVDPDRRWMEWRVVEWLT